jgi:hypothetical protein
MLAIKRQIRYLYMKSNLDSMGNHKKILNSQEISARLSDLIQRDFFHFEVKGLTRDTRDLISNFINALLERLGADPLSSFHLFSGLMEALLNAVKGNIRYTIFKTELIKRLRDVASSDDEVEQILSVIMDTSPLRDAMQRYIVPEKIKKEVQTILTLEEKIRVKKQALTDRDQQLLSMIREQIKKDNRRIDMKIRINEERLYIRINNDAPVLDTDMTRINASRIKHNELFKEGRSADFFRPENLDEKESAGFGIAMIDEGFYNMGLDPLDLFTYMQGKHSTTVHLHYPLDKLRAGAFAAFM